MTIIQNFIKVWEYNIENKIQYKKLETFIPKIWQAILTNDGSLTRNLSIIESTNINISMIKEVPKYFLESNSISQINSANSSKQSKGRKVWLIKDNTKVVFAQSLLYKEDIMTPSFSAKKAIGKTLIASELNIHRKLKSIYLGYSTCLENHFESYGPLWGRNYHICLDKKDAIVIDEIFAPNNIKSIPSINQNINV